MWGAIIGAATSVAGGIIGGVQSSNARKRAAKVLDEQERRAKGVYNRDYNQDYTQTASAQNALRKAREITDEYTKKAEAKQAIMGGTDESVAATKEAGNKVIADATSQIAEEGEKRRDAAAATYERKMDAIDAARRGDANAEAQANAQAGSQVMAAGMNLASTDITNSLQGKNMFGLDSDSSKELRVNEDRIITPLSNSLKANGYSNKAWADKQEADMKEDLMKLNFNK